MISDSLYPPIEPFAQYRLDVGNGHRIYVEESGNRCGIPIIFLHGGPGGSIDACHRRFFNPDVYRAILFDQRGCGKSEPVRCLEHNTTEYLIADIETIRHRLGIDRWVLFGGSWGSTLALAYGQRFPKSILGLILRGVFLGQDDETDWAFSRVARIFRPEIWQHMVSLLPDAERDDPIHSWGRRILDRDPAVARPAAWIWHDYEGLLSCFDAGEKRMPISMAEAATRDGWPGSPLLEWHYMRHHFFLRPGQLLDRCSTLRHVPCFIVQGRYDLVCPPRSAFLLAQAWGQECRLRWVEDAGHSAGHPPLIKALREALSDIADIIGC